MALGDLSSRSAVLEAIAEYDRLGQAAFLRKYGFGRAREYYLLHGGRRYDSKAIAGAAHGYQFRQPLQAADFSGGEATVASKLRALGFQVITDRSDTTWEIAIGQTLTRRELQQHYGGAPYGGIEPSRSTPNVLLFTDPATGERHGYFDGWADDGCFHYTGEGQHGDQRFREGNKAVRDFDLVLSHITGSSNDDPGRSHDARGKLHPPRRAAQDRRVEQAPTAQLLL